MRASVLTAAHTFETVQVPDPTPSTGEVVLRVRACGICGSDLKSHTSMPAGAVLGHEFFGEVVAVGLGADGRLHEGDIVAAMPLSACGRCRWCVVGEPAHCATVDLFGLGGSSGAFAEYVRASSATAVRLRDGIGDFGALVEPLAVGLHAVMAGTIRPHERVLVIGGGHVGASVALWARRLGAGDVVISDPSPTKRASAGRFGATDVHDPADGPVMSGFDVVFECVGAPGLVQTSIDAASVHGRVVVAGVCMEPERIVPLAALLKEVELRFAVYYRTAEFAAAAALLNDNTFDGSAFIGGVTELDGVQDAFDRLLSGAVERKIIVKPGG